MHITVELQIVCENVDLTSDEFKNLFRPLMKRIVDENDAKTNLNLKSIGVGQVVVRRKTPN